MNNRAKSASTPNAKVVRYTALGAALTACYAGLSYALYRNGAPFQVFGYTAFSSTWVLQDGLALAFAIVGMTIQFRERRARPTLMLLGFAFIFAGLIYFGLFAMSFADLIRNINAQNVAASDRWSTERKAVGNFLHNYGAALPGFFLLLLIGWISEVYARWRFLIDTDETSGVYGESHLANKAELAEKGLVGGTKTSPVGRVRETTEIISYDFTERIIVAASQTGKDRGVVLPAMLLEDRGMIAYDPKAEAWAVTAIARSERNGGREIIALDPFGVLKDPEYLSEGRDVLCKKTYRFDPLTFMSAEPEIREREISGLASALVVRSGAAEAAGKDSHFDDYAEIFYQGYLHYAFTRWDTNGRPPADRPKLTDLLAAAEMSEKEFKDLLEKMKLTGGRAKGAANRIESTGHDEFGSILSTIYRHVAWMADLNMRDMLQDSNFDPLLVFENLADVYIVVPEDQMKTHNRFVRLVFQTFISLLQQLTPSQKPKKSVWFLINEAHLLGYVPGIEAAWNIIGGRGGRIWMVFQNLSQMRVYPQHQVFQAAGVKHIFGTDDQDTLKWAMFMGGKSTELSESFSAGFGSSSSSNQRSGGSSSGNRGVSIREVSADVLTVDVLRTMPPDEQLVFMRGVNPVRCLRMPYDTDKLFVGKYRLNPLIKYKSA